MSTRTRAVHAEDKVERRNAILDTAERLLHDEPQRMPSMDDLAQQSGIAKGTVYLYFPSKEELLLALHERHTKQFFAALDALLASRARVEVADMVEVVRQRMIAPPVFLPLAARCFGLMESSVPIEAAVGFKRTIARLLEASGAAVERHFPALNPGDGATLLINSYALIVGLWQLLHPTRVSEAIGALPERAMFERDYAQELNRALTALWVGQIGQLEAHLSAQPKRSTRRIAS